jgi:hypothetical protein
MHSGQVQHFFTARLRNAAHRQVHLVSLLF